MGHPSITWILISKTLPTLYFLIPPTSSDLLSESLYQTFWNSRCLGNNPRKSRIPLVEFPSHSCSERKLVFSCWHCFSLQCCQVVLVSPHFSHISRPGRGVSSLSSIASSVPFFSFPENTLPCLCRHQITPLTIALGCDLPSHRPLEERTFAITGQPPLSL